MTLPQTWSLALNNLTRVTRQDAPSIIDVDCAFDLWTLDGEECQNIDRKSKSIVTYPMVLVNHVAIHQLCIRPSYGNWIIIQSQIQAKENRQTLEKLLYTRLNGWTPLFKDVIKTYIPAYEMGDGKCLYCLTGHSHWMQKNHPFMRCD